MNKILICLEVPALQCQHEMLVPEEMQVKEMLPLLVRAVKDLSGGTYVSSGHEFLCARWQELLLDGDATLRASGIGNGDHLLLL